MNLWRWAITDPNLPVWARAFLALWVLAVVLMAVILVVVLIGSAL